MPTPQLDRIPQTTYKLEGVLQRYLTAVSDNWLKVAPRANPGILEMFRDRDHPIRRDLMPHSGEFVGKYLTSAVQVWRLTHEPALCAVIADFVVQLLACQDVDGYLGPFPKEVRLENRMPPGETNYLDGQTWDTWGHYHLMLGLLLWYEECEDKQILTPVCKMADLICRRYLGAPVGRRLVDSGLKDSYGWTGTQMNLSPIHSFCLLYQKTKTGRYLDLARQITHEFEADGPDGPIAGDYIRTALAGLEFYETPRPRWESLHAIMGLAELYYITGDEDLRHAFEHIWWSLVKLDRHNNGGFSSGEQAQGNPYHQGAIETCCTIAWMALSIEMLRLTGNSVVADELELSTLNSVIGLHSSSGRWITYNTPMDGERRAFVQDINWQCRPGSPEINCCSVNAPRGFGLLSDWALMADTEGLVLNYYGPGEMETQLSSGLKVRLSQNTEYPRTGYIALSVEPEQTQHFGLKLRIPYWSAQTAVRLNGEPLNNITPGSYLLLTRHWQPGDLVEIELDLSPHMWVGEQECEGKTSLYRGPLLLTYDAHDNPFGPDDIPELDANDLEGQLLSYDKHCPPIILQAYSDEAGRVLRLRDFGSAGEAGTVYRSWLKVRNGRKGKFSRTNPLRSTRPGDQNQNE
jgi:DUF1680 family protein